jgi:GR25 family glycosyltransferase involved in LPS biosynthesis
MTERNKPVFAIDFRSPDSVIGKDLSFSDTFQVHWLPAVDATTDPRWLERDNPMDSFEIGRGAAGCLLAHQDAWKAISDLPRGIYAIVLESDAVMTDFGRKHLDEVLERSGSLNANLVQLATGRGHLANGHRQSLGVQAARVKDVVEQRLMPFFPPQLVQSYGMGTIAYALRPKYAQWLSKQRLGFGIPVDNWLRVWALDNRHEIFRCRQDCWRESGRVSSIEHVGRV